MLEFEKAAREILDRLPKDHPERRAIEGHVLLAESYNARARLDGKETSTGVKRFSPETGQVLEREGYVIYELTGHSVRSLREAGRKFWSTWHKDYPEFEALTSRRSEVAINPRKLFLPKSNGKTLAEQESIVQKFSQQLAEKILGVEAIIGEAADYTELAFLHLDRTGDYLFGEKYDYNWARTKTPTVGSYVAYVGDFYVDDGLSVSRWRRDDGYAAVFVAPLVVPK